MTLWEKWVMHFKMSRSDKLVAKAANALPKECEHVFYPHRTGFTIDMCRWQYRNISTSDATRRGWLNIINALWDLARRHDIQVTTYERPIPNETPFVSGDRNES